MNLIFLQNCISPHQMPYIKELPVYESVDRVVVVAPRIDYDDRKQMGHDMEALVWETAEELDKKLAERMRRIRRRRKVSQQKLSDMSGVSYGSIKRFETTGQISLLSLTKLAMALELADELRDLFTQVPYRNIQEVINESKGKS